MLLKIYTCQNSIKLIDGIEDAEIHLGEYRVENYSQLYDAIGNGPGMFRGTSHTPETVESYDWDINTPITDAALTPLNGNLVKYVDYQKAGTWRRVAIQQYAYLCNDDGKTIAKIGC